MLIALAFVVGFTLPAMAAPRASPIALVGEMILASTSTAADHQTFLGSTDAQIQEENTIFMIQVPQVRTIGTLPLSFAPVALRETIASTFSFGQRQEQGAAYYNNLTNICMATMATAPRTEDAFIVGVSPVLRL